MTENAFSRQTVCAIPMDFSHIKSEYLKPKSQSPKSKTLTEGKTDCSASIVHFFPNGLYMGLEHSKPSCIYGLHSTILPIFTKGTEEKL